MKSLRNVFNSGEVRGLESMTFISTSDVSGTLDSDWGPGMGVEDVEDVNEFVAW